MAKIIIPAFERQTITITNNCDNHYHIILNESSKLQCSIALKDIDNLKLTIEVDLKGFHAKAILDGYYVLKNQQSVEVQITLNHEREKTFSKCLMKGVLFDQAYSRVNGLVSIQKNSFHANARFENKVLIFDRAKAISIPTMEVKVHEVQCSHGSAIGKVDEEVLFYMQSRGLIKKNAISLIIDGFLQEVSD